MDTSLPLIKAWKKKNIEKKIESSFTFDTFKFFFHQKKLACFPIGP
jgi:hypothetical protein